MMMTDVYENYLYFNVNELNGSRKRFDRFLAFLESFDIINVTY